MEETLLLGSGFLTVMLSCCPLLANGMIVTLVWGQFFLCLQPCAVPWTLECYVLSLYYGSLNLMRNI